MSVLADLDATTKANVEAWLQNDFDASTKGEVERLLREDPETLTDSFYQTLTFGTAGLRGLMGVGSNRMNVYTVGGATQGLANYLKKTTPSARVLIGYDSRHHSHRFAETAARVLANNGIQVYLFEALRPVPLVSFGVRHLRCNAGIMITASHNPPLYNGYKVYWSDGAQVLPPHDKGIIHEVEAIVDLASVKSAPATTPLITYLGDQVEQAYFTETLGIQCRKEQNQAHGKELQIVYTSLHGTGITMVPKLLELWGFSNYQLVATQCIPDGDFPTAKSPNPEETEAMRLGTTQLAQVRGDILIGTDPDADRIGVGVWHQGKVELLNGNEIACLCLDHLCSSRSLPKNGACIKTIVTTELFAAIAKSYGVTCFNVLTGFKYIGALVEEWAHSEDYTFIFGGEESYGFLAGAHARDKDAVSMSGVIAELALELKLQGKTLIDRLLELYKKHGTYREGLTSIVYEGKTGAERIHSIMNQLRNSPLKKVGGIGVQRHEDYLKGLKHLPPADVLIYWLEDDSRIIIRPSGTEPKIKVYGAVVERHGTLVSADDRLKALLQSFKQELP